MKADLSYFCPDGIWTRFHPETPRGVEAWETMAAALPDGIVAFLPAQVPGVLAQLRGAGLSVRKAPPHKPLDTAEIDALLAELEA